MVAEVAIYTVVHQPRRLQLPAQPIPHGASIADISHCVFDERMNERYFRKVAASSYYPATRLFLELVRQGGLQLSLGFSLSFVSQAAQWEPALLDLMRELVAEENNVLHAMEPYLPTRLIRHTRQRGTMKPNRRKRETERGDPFTPSLRRQTD